MRTWRPTGNINLVEERAYLRAATSKLRQAMAGGGRRSSTGPSPGPADQQQRVPPALFPAPAVSLASPPPTSLSRMAVGRDPVSIAAVQRRRHTSELHADDAD